MYVQRYRAPLGARSHLALLLGLAFLPALRIGAQAPSIAPQLAFEASAVTVSGATPAGGVVVFGMGRDGRRAIPRVLRLERELTADAEGAARLDLPEPVMAHSVWAAVDVATGAYGLAAPEGTEVDRIDAGSEGLGANVRLLDYEGRFLDLLLVRPESGPDGPEAAGFWGIEVGDGAGFDRDGEANGRLTVDVTSLLSLGDSPAAPEKLRPKDVVIGVDPRTLRIFAQRLADGPDDGGGGPGNGGTGSTGAGGE